MKFRQILQFELGFQLRRFTTYIYLVVVVCLVVLVTVYSMVDNVQREEYYLNSPVIIAFLAAISSMFGLLLNAAVSGNATERDMQARIESLLYTTALKKTIFLGGRFLAVFIINLLVIVLMMMMLFIASFVPGMAAFFTSTGFSSYLGAFLLFAVPNAFITTGIIFSLGILSRRSMVGYAGAALLFLIAFMTMDMLAGELGLWELGKKLDPSGLTVIKEQRLFNTPPENKWGLIKLDASLVMNRLLWLGVAFAFLAMAYIRFSFTYHASGKRKKTGSKTPEASGKLNWNRIATSSLPADSRTFNHQTAVRQAIFLTNQTFWQMVKGKVWLLIVATLVIIVVTSEEVLEGQLGIPMLATSWRVLQLLDRMTVSMAMAVVISYYAGELVWRERDARQSALVDASPVPTWGLFLSKFIALILMLLLMQGMFLVAGSAIQLMHGYANIDIPLYLQVLFGFRFADLLLFALVALGLHVLVNQKYVGHLLVFLAYYIMKFPEDFGLVHKLLIFGSDPGWSYSEISGFEPYVVPWLWFKLYWIGWALLLALIILLFWNRGKEGIFQKRINQARLQLSSKLTMVGVVAIFLIFLLGSFIFYNTNFLNDYVTATDKTRLKAQYEKNYGRYRNIPQPLLSSVKLYAEIYPEKREMEISGLYWLINKTAIELDTIHISTALAVETDNIIFSKKTETILVDKELGHRIYKLDEALQPGDSISLSYIVYLKQQGFSNSGIDRSILENGTYIDHHYMPAIGYKTYRELSDKQQRKEHELDPRPAMRSLYDTTARMRMDGEEKIRFEAVLGTAASQTAVTAGALHSTWLKNGRRYYRYVAEASIRHNYEILSAKYALHKDQWKGVEIQIYHHPTHTKNLERMVQGVKMSLDYFTENFSPYPHSQIRLAEYPGNDVNLNGTPVSMSYSEGFSYFDVEGDSRRLEFPTAVIGHEVAHQWWGNELSPAYVEGAGLLTESLAWYSSIIVMEKNYGAEHLGMLLRVMRQEYLKPRSAADVPLIRTSDKFSAYRRGPFTMYTLKEYLGEKSVNTALRSMLEKFGTGEPPLPVSLDLYAELQAVTPDSLQYLLEDLFIRNTFWDLKAEKAVVKPTLTGEWEVMLEIEANKVAIDEDGAEASIPMNDYVEIGIYGNSPEEGLGELLYLKKHQLKAGERRLTITVQKEPDLAGIDPNRLLIDRQMFDNFTTIANDKESKKL